MQRAWKKALVRYFPNEVLQILEPVVRNSKSTSPERQLLTIVKILKRRYRQRNL